MEGLFAGQQYVGQWKADIHSTLTLSHTLLLELLHLLWVSWDHHLRHDEEHLVIDDLDLLLNQWCLFLCQRTSSVSNMVRLEENGELLLSPSSQWLSKKTEPRSLMRFTPPRPDPGSCTSPPRTRTDILCAQTVTWHYTFVFFPIFLLEESAAELKGTRGSSRALQNSKTSSLEVCIR